MRLYYAMSEGDKNQIDALKGTEVMEFFTILSVREEVINAQIERMKK